jgi:hypothetical protein
MRTTRILQEVLGGSKCVRQRPHKNESYDSSNAACVTIASVNSLQGRWQHRRGVQYTDTSKAK